MCICSFILLDVPERWLQHLCHKQASHRASFDIQDENELDARGQQSSWDDDFVLKHQFSALIPAFDPRPGRSNVNQTQDFEIPPDCDEEPPAMLTDDTKTTPKLVLTLSASCLTGVCMELFVNVLFSCICVRTEWNFIRLFSW